MSGKMLSVALAVAAVVGVSSANANLIAYEGFDGTPSGFSTNFPAATGGFKGNPTGASLTYGSLATSGVARSGGHILDNKGILSTPVTSGTVWMSWLYKTGNPAADWNRLITFVGTGAGSPGERYNLGAVGDTFTIRGVFGTGNRPTVTLTKHAADTTYMLVAKYEFNAAGTDDGVITLWLNPDVSSLGTGTAPTGGTMGSAINVSDDGMGFAGLGLHGEEGADATYDELRIGDSWASVSPTVPEPAAMALLAGSSLLALRRRSR